MAQTGDRSVTTVQVFQLQRPKLVASASLVSMVVTKARKAGGGLPGALPDLRGRALAIHKTRDAVRVMVKAGVPSR